jgi:hypothetical protein
MVPQNANPNDHHNWGSHKWGYSWSECKWCGASRMYDSAPGWPGWYTYFTLKGDYSGPHGRSPGPCTGDPQLELNL